MNKKIKKIRADSLLVSKKLCDSEKEAKTLIMAGKVRIGADHVILNASIFLPEDADIIVEQPSPYVSRGAYKLKPALDKYLPDLTGMTALDVGASTGGFTDLMLQYGADKVYTVDSGRGQLHSKLRTDPRVSCHEKVNARLLKTDFLPEKVNIITMDVSFISATAILPAVSQFLKPDGWAFILVKPQFEAPKRDVETGGVVRSESVREACVKKVCDFAVNELNWQNKTVIPCPITGPKGNLEFIAVFSAS
jgi:23S rRNA (cytidine1920-2'-O)/16S rRNA (cytidine1409-2'-O)-methyltransferase